MVQKFNPESAYIHIPFCRSKCNYCSFVSGDYFDKKTGYLYSLLKEIDYYYSDEPLKTLYLGGGTPSCMDLEEIKKIVSKFRLEDNAEVTIEVNPNDVTSEYMNGLFDLGFNRVSMGAQSFDDNILKLIGRRHTSSEIYSAVENTRKAGFKNISLDLIYGLPTQTLSGFEHDLTEVINLDVEHISLYGLKIDEGCYFYKNPPENLPDDDVQADMYIMAGELTAENGYEHYEVSNYSKSGYNSKHNSNYWECKEYYGFGLAAHGYVDGVRYSNTSSIDEYLNSPVDREFGKFLTEKEKLEERIFLGLRLAKGINIDEINADFNIDFCTKYKDVLNKYLKTGHIEETKIGYKLSDNPKTNGFLLSNVILADFMEDS